MSDFERKLRELQQSLLDARVDVTQRPLERVELVVNAIELAARIGADHRQGEIVEWLRSQDPEVNPEAQFDHFVCRGIADAIAAGAGKVTP